MPKLVYQSATVGAFTPNHMCMKGHNSDILPHCDTGIMGHPTGHDSFSPLDDALVLWRLSDACASWKKHSGPFTQRIGLKLVVFFIETCTLQTIKAD